MELNVKKTGQDVLKWTVAGGGAVIAVGAIMQLTKTTNLKSAIMPIVTLLVGVSAFSYAMSAEKITLIPEVGGSKESTDETATEGEKKSNYTTPRAKVVGNKFVCPPDWKWSNAERKCVPAGFGFSG